MAVGMVLIAILSVQCGAAIATGMFDDVGPAGAVFLRFLFAALLLIAAAGRGFLAGLDRRLLCDAIPFGLVLGAMSLSFYAAIDRLPLGTAVTIEFIGPLGVALAASRQRRDLLWVALAATGVVLLTGGIEGGSEAVGIALALLAAACWAAYIVLNARIGSRHEGLAPLAVAMTVAALLALPFGAHAGGADLLSPPVLAAGLAIGLLSSALPYALELEALRRLPSGTFGVLMSLEPVAAALVGFLALSQDLAPADLLAVALVVIASAGALRSGRARPLDS
jgi:inner membrane transporter RhtA